MKISIIVAAYNVSDTLQRCINSVTEQEVCHVELIVIDGGSTDGTVEILKTNNDLISYWESKADRGIYHAWNKGLCHAHGDWICFLGADDYFASSKVLAEMAPFLHKAYPRYRVVYGQLALANKADEIMYCLGAPWPKLQRRFMQLMSLPHPGLMHHKSMFEVNGVFDESFLIAGDYELLLRELRQHDALFVPGVVVAVMRQGGVSSDPSRTILALTEVRRAHKKNLMGGSGLRWWLAYFKARIRILLWRILGKKTAGVLLDMARMCVGKKRHWTRL